VQVTRSVQEEAEREEGRKKKVTRERKTGKKEELGNRRAQTENELKTGNLLT
jgi:hypothetical protein